MNKLRSYDEILQREKLSLDHHVTLTNFDSLISEIDLPKNEEGLTTCQIRKVHNNCNHHFMHGYLVLTSEGKEAILGKDCGNKYFILDEKFALQRNQLSAQIERDEAVETLSRRLSQINEENLSNTEHSLKEVAKAIRKVMSIYPDFTKRRLEQIEKARNTSVSVDVQYEEIDENGKKTTYWVPEFFGNIKGTYICPYKDNIGHTVQLLRKVKETLPKIDLNDRVKTKQLKEWIKTLSLIDEITSNLDNIRREYERFIEPENILMTTLLTRSMDARKQIVRLGFNDGRQHSKKTLSEFDKRVRNFFGNRNFKVAA